jgi:hypothetical protein
MAMVDGAYGGRSGGRATTVGGVSAERDIEALLHEYARRIDDGDFAGVGLLFERGRILDDRGRVVAEGATPVQALFETTTRRFDDGTPRTQHLTTNVVIDVDPGEDRARGRYYLTEHQAGEGTLAPIVGGRYDDRFAANEDGWHFIERAMHVRIIGDVSRHLLVDLGERDGGER